MALSPELEALVIELEKIDPVAGKAQRDLLEKNEKISKHLQESTMRQADYTRKQNELKEEVEYGKTMRKWADDNVPKFDAMKKERDDAQTRAAALEAEVKKQAEVAAAAAGAGGDKVDPNVIAQAVLAKLSEGGFVSKTEIADEIKKVTDQLGNVKNDFFTKTFPAASKWQAEFTNAQLLYKDETGKILDETQFSKFMFDNKLESPKAAFDKFMEPARTEKKIKDDAERRFQDLMKERSKEFPGSSGPASSGHLQVRLNKKDANDPLFSKDAELGDGSLAAAAAAELSSEGK